MHPSNPRSPITVGYRFASARVRDAKQAALDVASIAPWHRGRVLSVELCGGEVHPTATLHRGVRVHGANGVVIGPRSIVGPECIVDGRGGLILGSDVNVSGRAQLWSAQHDWRSPDFAFVTAPVHVHDHVWIGPNVVVLPGVTIGKGAVVAAGTVVTRDLEPMGLYAGVPARRIGERPSGLRYRLPVAKRKAWWQ
ncbi:DapH/DapD/GlmU-related protein [Cellulomonas sp. Root485]|uniref:acyltransferase n=1 Tax=Cellulomonas sp. Root485 TaxID=1736546 RepID=UPI0009E9FB21|nr:acyltransferase [Cellulomonas sp. Root485]